MDGVWRLFRLGPLAIFVLAAAGGCSAMNPWPAWTTWGGDKTSDSIYEAQKDKDSEAASADRLSKLPKPGGIGRRNAGPAGGLSDEAREIEQRFGFR